MGFLICFSLQLTYLSYNYLITVNVTQEADEQEVSEFS